MNCHSHDNGFGHGGGGGAGCGGTGCHGETGSHATHTKINSKGPATQMDCGDCHDTNNYPNFGDPGEDASLAATDVCDDCHSEGGAYNGLIDTAESIGAKDNWDEVYNAVGDALLAGKEKWCIGCHDGGTSVINDANAPNTDLYYTGGHGRAGAAKECLDCHDTTKTHIDGEARTYAFDSAYYDPNQSGVAYAEGYRLRYVGGEVPLMIPADLSITFDLNAQTIKDNSFRLCFDCHNPNNIFDNDPSDGIDTNFKASLPNPPRGYSYGWGAGNNANADSDPDFNEHFGHIWDFTGIFWDSDWNMVTNGTTGSNASNAHSSQIAAIYFKCLICHGDFSFLPKNGMNGSDSLIACASCHNVHCAIGAMGSTNEAMIRDGSLPGRTGYRFSYVIEDGTYPQMTSTGANQANSVGAVFRNNTADMCGGCHGNPDPPAASYDASGSGWGSYLEYYRP